MGRLDGKVALITGAAHGIGEAAARLFASEGARVVVADIDEAKGAEVVTSLGDAALFVRLDVASAADWTGAMTRTEAVFGGLDVLINNAGAYGATGLQDSTEAEFDYLVSMNQRSVFLGMKAATPMLARAGGASIVNVSSSAGLRGGAGMINYRTVKWAIRGMTRSAAHDLGSLGIRVNSVHPGAIDTRMLRAGNSASMNDMTIQRTLLKRIGRPVEVAQAMLFLASDDASYVTGAEVVVDGGVSA